MLGKRLGVLTIAVGLLTLGLGGTASATDEAPKVHKSYVCKYVGTPGPGERLQTGQNPIFVDNSALSGKDEEVNVGDTFADGQGFSVVIVANTEKLDPEPSVTDCPLTPPEPEVTTDEEVRKSCEAGVESREVTITTPYVYDYEMNEWVLDPENAETTYGEWMFVRNLTAEERAELECDKTPPQPDDKVTVSAVPDERRDCDGVELRETVTRTVTPYVLVDGKWVLDTKNAMTTTNTTEWVFVRDLTDSEKDELNCNNEPVSPNDEDPPAPPEVELPHTGASSMGLMALLGSMLIGSGVLLYRKFSL